MEEDEKLTQIKLLYEFEKQKTNRLILSNSKLNEYTIHLQKYFHIKKDIFEKNQGLYIQKLKQNLLENSNLYEEKDGIYSSKNIQVLHFELDAKEWNNLFQVLFQIKQIRSYLYRGLQNAIVESSKTFFDMDYDSKVVIFHSNDSIEKSEFGMYFYLLYIQNKYANKLCVLDLDPFEKVLQDILVVDKAMSQDKVNEDYSEEKKIYDFMVLGLWNRNLYLYQLISAVLENLVKENELFYDFNEQKLIVGSTFEKKLQKCLLSDKDFTLIPLTLEFSDEDSIHQNIILVDNHTLTAERFEPHGSTREPSEKQMNQKLGYQFARSGILYQPHVCLKEQIQVFENMVPESLQGKCVTLSLDYLKYRLDDKLNPKDAPLVYYSDVYKKGIIHWKEISEANDKIYNSMQKYLDILNQTFGTSLRFSGTLLEFD